MKIIDAEGIAESASKFFKLEDFASVGLFVDAMKRFDGARDQIVVDGAIRGEHELLDDAMSDVAFAAGKPVMRCWSSNSMTRLGQIEVDGAIFVAARVQQLRQAFHAAEVVIQVSVTRGHFRIAVRGLCSHWCRSCARRSG